MGKSKPPAPPNPYQTADAQQQLNLQTLEETQAANQTNQISPFGSLTYGQTGTGPGGVPTYTLTQSLSPQEQQLLSTLQGTQSTAGQAGQQLLGSAGYGGAPNFTQGADNITTQLMQHETGFLNPFFQQAHDNLDNQLRNQGIMPGSEAYKRAMNNQVQSQGQAVSGFLAQAEPMAFQQAVQGYEEPARMAQNLAGFGSPQMPGQLSTPQAQMQPANLIGAVNSAYNAQMQAYQAQLQQQNAMLNGISRIGTGLVGMF